MDPKRQISALPLVGLIVAVLACDLNGPASIAPTATARLPAEPTTPPAPATPQQPTTLPREVRPTPQSARREALHMVYTYGVDQEEGHVIWLGQLGDSHRKIGTVGGPSVDIYR